MVKDTEHPSKFFLKHLNNQFPHIKTLHYTAIAQTLKGDFNGC